MDTITERVDALDWDALRERLDEDGHAITPVLLDGAETDELAELFDGGRFRSTIDMARHRFGEGRYRYFDHPLPDADRRAARAPSTATWRRSPTTGRSGCAARTARSRSSTRSCSSSAARRARSGRRR